MSKIWYGLIEEVNATIAGWVTIVLRSKIVYAVNYRGSYKLSVKEIKQLIHKGADIISKDRLMFKSFFMFKVSPFKLFISGLLSSL